VTKSTASAITRPLAAAARPQESLERRGRGGGQGRGDSCARCDRAGKETRACDLTARLFVRLLCQPVANWAYLRIIRRSRHVRTYLARGRKFRAAPLPSSPAAVLSLSFSFIGGIREAAITRIQHPGFAGPAARTLAYFGDRDRLAIRLGRREGWRGRDYRVIGRPAACSRSCLLFHPSPFAILGRVVPVVAGVSSLVVTAADSIGAERCIASFRAAGHLIRLSMTRARVGARVIRDGRSPDLSSRPCACVRAMGSKREMSDFSNSSRRTRAVDDEAEDV